MKQIYLWPAFWKISYEICSFLTFVQLLTHIRYTKDLLSFSNVGIIHLEGFNRLLFTFMRLWEKERFICFDHYYNKKMNCMCAKLFVMSSSVWPYGLCSLPGSSVHGILQARKLEWVAQYCPPPGDLPDPEIEPVSPALAGRFFTASITGKAQLEQKLLGINLVTLSTFVLKVWHDLFQQEFFLAPLL